MDKEELKMDEKRNHFVYGSKEAPAKLDEAEVEIAIAIRRIQDLKKSMVEDYLEIGDILNRIKPLIPHGEWENWLVNQIAITPRHAQQMMKVSKSYPKDKRLDYGGISFTKLLTLTRLEQEERDEFVRLNNCEKMTVKELSNEISMKKNHKVALDELNKKEILEKINKDIDILAFENKTEKVKLADENIRLKEENIHLKLKIDSYEEEKHGSKKIREIVELLDYLTEELEVQKGDFSLKLSNNKSEIQPYKNYFNSKIKLLEEYILFINEALGGRE